MKNLALATQQEFDHVRGGHSTRSETHLQTADYGRRLTDLLFPPDVLLGDVDWRSWMLIRLRQWLAILRRRCRHCTLQDADCGGSLRRALFKTLDNFSRLYSLGVWVVPAIGLSRHSRPIRAASTERSLVLLG